MEGAQGLVPKLRFPEFQDAEPWKLRELSELLSEPKKKNRDLKYGPEHVLSVSGEYGCVNQIDFMGRSYAGASVKEYNVVETEDIVYTKSPLKACPNGIIKANKGATGIVSVLYAVYRPTAASRSDFLDFYFSSDHKLNTYLQPLVKKGPKNSILVNNSDVLKGRIGAPDVIEQQKIAACLSSLDALIAAETEKLTALRDHKKGLTHRLFPAEGETTPRLRLPEFQDAGEWKEKRLDAICNIQRGKFSHRPRNDPRFFGGKYPFIQTGDVVASKGGPVRASQSLNELGLSVSKLFQPPIVLVTIAANIGDTGILDTEACFTDSVVGLTPNIDCCPYFLESIVRGKKKYLNQIAPAAAQKNINNEILSVLPVLVPSFAEQQRIAAFLSSIDALIVAQDERVDTLKSHKNGLMQQLFLSPVEAVV